MCMDGTHVRRKLDHANKKRQTRHAWCTNHMRKLDHNTQEAVWQKKTGP